MRVSPRSGQRELDPALPLAGHTAARESLAEGWYGGHSPEWAEFLMEPEEAEELDRDHVLVRVLVRARGARSGAEISHLGIANGGYSPSPFPLGRSLPSLIALPREPYGRQRRIIGAAVDRAG